MCVHSHPALCDHTGSSVHGLFQPRILEWVTISSSRKPSWPRDPTHMSSISFTADRFFSTEPPGKSLSYKSGRWYRFLRSCMSTVYTRDISRIQSSSECFQTLKRPHSTDQRVWIPKELQKDPTWKCKEVNSSWNRPRETGDRRWIFSLVLLRIVYLKAQLLQITFLMDPVTESRLS